MVLELIIFAVIFGFLLSKIIPDLKMKKRIREAHKIIKNTPPKPSVPQNELLSYRQGGSLWVEYYAQCHTTREWLRNFAALESANQIREWLNRDYLEVPAVRITYARKYVQFTEYFVSMSQPEYQFVKSYREHIGEQSIRTAFQVLHEYVPPHITFEQADLTWLYRATLSNLDESALYMHDGVIYKDAEHYRLYTNWRNAGRA